MKTITTISTFVPNKKYNAIIKAHYGKHIDLSLKSVVSVTEETSLDEIETFLLNSCIKECNCLPYQIIIN